MSIEHAWRIACDAVSSPQCPHRSTLLPLSPHPAPPSSSSPLHFSPPPPPPSLWSFSSASSLFVLPRFLCNSSSKNCWADSEGATSPGSSHMTYASHPPRQSKLTPIPQSVSCCSQQYCKCRKSTKAPRPFWSIQPLGCLSTAAAAAAAPCAATKSIAEPPAGGGVAVR